MLRLLHAGLLVLTLAAYLPPWLNPEYAWIISPLSLVAPLLWGCLLLFGLYWGYRRRRAGWWSLLVLLLGLPLMRNVVATAGPNTQVSDETTHLLRVASLNGMGFLRPRGKDAATHRAQVVEYCKALQVDLLMLQEFQHPRLRAALLNDLSASEHFPHTYTDSDGLLAIFSKYPLEDGRSQYSNNSANGYQQIDLIHPGGRIRLLNLHLQTNALSGMAHDVSRERDLQDRETWRKVKTMFGRYARSNRLRTQQVQEIMQEVDQSEYPVIVAGDFNDVPSTRLYTLARRQLQDAHLAAGRGFGTTYGGLLPALRIDYILPSETFTVYSTKTVACPFSDHEAVRSVIGF